MQVESPACPVCGGSEYYKDCGFYYCLECQTQSQEIREEVHDYFVTGFKAKTAIPKLNSKTKAGGKNKCDDLQEWTTWEYYNFILKGMVDELIDLGATRKLKIVVLQLWASYLKKIEVAFTTKVDTTKLPKLGVKYHPRDARLIYGYKKKRSKRKTKRKSEASSGASVSGISTFSDHRSAKLAFSKSKRDLAEAEYAMHYSAESQMGSGSVFDSSLRTSDMSSRLGTDSETESRPPSIQYSFAARQQHRTMGKRVSNKNTDIHRNVFLTHSLSRVKLLAFLYIGLRILREEIQLSDLLRWVEEGELSYYEVTHFYPDELRFRGYDITSLGVVNHRPAYESVNIQAMELAKFLDIEHLPTPDLLSLARRFIEDLQLPEEIVKYVECVMNISSPSKVTPKFKSTKHLPNYEARAMAFIIFILKLLLGLDGKTEHEISKACKKLNRLHVKAAGLGEFFVWDDWVQYIECRKSVIARFHVPTQAELLTAEFTDPNSFIKFWEKVKAKDEKKKDKIINLTRIHPELRKAVKQCFVKLAESDVEDTTTINFAPSLTPQKTHLNTIIAAKLLDNQPNEEPSPANILNQDFSTTTLCLLINPRPCIAVARDKNAEVLVVKKSAQTEVKKTDKMKKEYVDFQTQKRTYIIERRRKLVQNENQSVSEVFDDNSSVDSDGDSDSSSGIFNNVSDIAESILKENSELEKMSAKQNERLFKFSKEYKNLPIIAEQILLKQLKNNDIPVNSTHKIISNNRSSKFSVFNSDKCSQDGPNGKNKGKGQNKEKHSRKKVTEKVVLNLPHENYWLNEISSKNYTNDDFERLVAIEFPPSFSWLLTECSRMLRTTRQHLYSELLNVELMHCYLFMPGGESLTYDVKRIISDIQLSW